jgi:K+-sensing histidine kinase KdpD
MARSEPHSQKSMLTVKRYGFAVLSVALALLPGLLLQHFAFHDVELPLLLFAVALTAWHVGGGPAALSIVLSSLCFDYFFAPPIYTLTLTPADIPAVTILVCFAVLIARFSTVRRRIEADLVQARDKLQVEVAERTQPACST